MFKNFHFRMSWITVLSAKPRTFLCFTNKQAIFPRLSTAKMVYQEPLSSMGKYKNYFPTDLAVKESIAEQLKTTKWGGTENE